MAKPKLKKTLPKELYELKQGKYFHEDWTDEDIQKAKEYLEPCHPDARERGGYKETALLYGMPLEIVKWLVERGADVNLANTYNTPLSQYTSSHDYEVCKYLLAHGADVTIETSGKITPIFKAADRGSYDIVKLLLEHGADPSHRSCKIFNDGNTPLLYMLQRNSDSIPEERYFKIAELLVKAQRERNDLPESEWKTAQKYVADIGHTINMRSKRQIISTS